MQENPNAIPEGETPHAVSMNAFDALLDVCKPGDRITVTGIYKAVPMRISPRLRALKVCLSPRPLLVRKPAGPAGAARGRRRHALALQSSDDLHCISHDAVMTWLDREVRSESKSLRTWNHSALAPQSLMHAMRRQPDLAVISAQSQNMSTFRRYKGGKERSCGGQPVGFCSGCRAEGGAESRHTWAATAGGVQDVHRRGARREDGGRTPVLGGGAGSRRGQPGRSVPRSGRQPARRGAAQHHRLLQGATGGAGGAHAGAAHPLPLLLSPFTAAAKFGCQTLFDTIFHACKVLGIWQLCRILVWVTLVTRHVGRATVRSVHHQHAAHAHCGQRWLL